MRRRGRQIERNAPKAVRQVALAVLQPLVTSTPVDSGRARSNWDVQIGAPAEGVREAFLAGQQGSTAGPNTQAALERGAAVIATFTAEDTEIHITNNLPYIGRLNEGSSAQAPAGFVEQAVQEGAAAVGQVRLLDD